MPHIVVEVTDEEHALYLAAKAFIRANNQTVKGFFLRKLEQEYYRLRKKTAPVRPWQASSNRQEG